MWIKFDFVNREKNKKTYTLRFRRGICVSGDIMGVITDMTPYLLTIALSCYARYNVVTPDQDDVKQDIALMLLTKLPRYDRRKSSIKTYMYYMVRNMVYDTVLGRLSSHRQIREIGVDIEYDSDHPRVSGVDMPDADEALRDISISIEEDANE